MRDRDCYLIKIFYYTKVWVLIQREIITQVKQSVFLFSLDEIKVDSKSTYQSIPLGALGTIRDFVLNVKGQYAGQECLKRHDKFTVMSWLRDWQQRFS